MPGSLLAWRLGNGYRYTWTLRYDPATEPIAASPAFRAFVKPKG